WSGDYFYDEELEEYDYVSSSIPYYQVEKWIMKDSATSDLGQSAYWARNSLKDESGSRWHMLHYGIRISTENHHYLLIQYYDKPSEINGAHWTSYWLDFDRQGNLEECLELGREGYSTSTFMIDEEEYFFARYTTTRDIDIVIKSEDDITVCTTHKFEIEGDLTDEELAAVNGTTVVNDSIVGYVHYYADECVEY
ncbi:MAG: hypothetical protein ACI857_001729, partial [Arenicella sp.]